MINILTTGVGVHIFRFIHDNWGLQLKVKALLYIHSTKDTQPIISAVLEDGVVGQAWRLKVEDLEKKVELRETKEYTSDEIHE